MAKKVKVTVKTIMKKDGLHEGAKDVPYFKVVKTENTIDPVVGTELSVSDIKVLMDSKRLTLVVQ